ncbi:MAG: N-acetylmuramoyl-L-alanine amidase [Pseudomonadota bacterium]
MGRFSKFLAACAVLSLPAVADEASEPALLGPDGVTLVDAEEMVQLSVELTRAVPWRLRFAEAPPRLIVEFLEVDLDGRTRVRSTSVDRIELTPTGADETALVAFLREPLAVATAEMKVEGEGARLEIALEPTTADAFRLDSAKALVASGTRTVVAIDPGHGGIDPGAQTETLDEADLVLDFARRLEEQLLETGQFDVVLTRRDDQFVSLDERLSRARAADADMFLSIHADALDGADASGMVVYSLASDAAPRANQRLTERHGADDLLSGVDLTGAGDDVANALIDLTRRENAPRTSALSKALVGAFEASGLPLNTRPERPANFAVLKAADMPSVLVELGFLSTEEDLKRLTSDEWQTEATLAIRNALMQWHEEDALR